jgi:hypothetical protein
MTTDPQALDQAAKARAFRDLHHRGARLHHSQSMGCGNGASPRPTRIRSPRHHQRRLRVPLSGKPTTRVTRAQVMRHLETIVAATPLSASSADLENGFGDSPDTVAETIVLAAAAGVVGGSIEDGDRTAGRPDLRPVASRPERVRAAAADRAGHCRFHSPSPPRCENYLVGRPDLADTIQRLQAYQEAGADVLYAPGLSDRG